MGSRLIGILGCLLLAYVVNYALGEFLDARIPRWTQERVEVDGSTLNTSLYFATAPDSVRAVGADGETLLNFYAYLDAGGAENYARWRASLAELRVVHAPFIERALTVSEWTNTVKYLSLLLLIATALGLVWVAGRIYRVGILNYGKKGGFADMGRWLFAKS